MNDVDANKNCHEYCRYAKQCRYCDGGNGWIPEDCAMYYKIEDLLNDARYDEMDERKARFEEGEDW